MDLAVTDFLSGLIYIMLGNGDGTFKLVNQYQISYAPGDFYIEDVDGDGNLDIVLAAGHPDALITQPYTQTVGVLFGNGDGTFAGAPAYLVPGGPTSIAVADFNGDGRPDLALAGNPGGISILLGSGGGKFAPPTRLTSPGGPYVGIAAADLNGDGKVDLAMNDSQNGAVVFLGNGDGTFQASQPVAGGGSDTSFLVIGDFNNDHKPDLAIANRTSNTVTVTLGKGDGTFGATATAPVGSNPIFIATGDFNNDGNLDLAVADAGTFGNSSDPGGLSILLGKGDGTFQNAANYQAGLTPGSVTAADFNHDGFLDLVVTASTADFGGTLVVFLGNGDGTFKPGVLIPTDFGPEKVAVADFNGDGKLDLVVPHCCGDSDITYLVGNGDGTFQKEAPFTFNGGAVTSAVADFNADGKPDIAFATETVNDDDSSVFVLLNVQAVSPQPVVNGVISASAFGAYADITAGSWIEIYGLNLASTMRPWTGADFSGANAPTMLDGTSVQINGKAAFVAYISSGQVNVLVPSGVNAGPASLTVTAGGVTSAPFSLTALATEPAMLAPASFQVQGKQFVVAQFTDGTYVAPAGAIAGLTSRPAKPGETIVIYGIGFGPAQNSDQQMAPVGQIASGFTTLTEKFTASFGDAEASASYAGLAPGLVGVYQFNLAVPDVADSDAVPFTFSLGGAAGAQTLYTAVQH